MLSSGNYENFRNISMKYAFNASENWPTLTLRKSHDFSDPDDYSNNCALIISGLQGRSAISNKQHFAIGRF